MLQILPRTKICKPISKELPLHSHSLPESCRYPGHYHGIQIHSLKSQIGTAWLCLSKIKRDRDPHNGENISIVKRIHTVMNSNVTFNGCL